MRKSSKHSTYALKIAFSLERFSSFPLLALDECNSKSSLDISDSEKEQHRLEQTSFSNSYEDPSILQESPNLDENDEESNKEIGEGC